MRSIKIVGTSNLAGPLVIEFEILNNGETTYKKVEIQGYSWEEVYGLVDHIADKMAWKFIFPPYEHADVKQEAIILGLEGLENYEERYPLDAFLRTHMKRRLCNFKRKNYMRLNKPCLTCPFKAYIKKTDTCTKFRDKAECDLYAKWAEITEVKKNILAPAHMERDHLVESDIPLSLSNKEIIDLIDKQIPLEYRAIWLKVKGNVKVSRVNFEQLKSQIEMILEENNIDVGQI